MLITLGELMAIDGLPRGSGSRFRRDEIKLPAIRPNVGVAATHYRQLAPLIDKMHDDVLAAVKDAYAPATLAMDEPSWKVLRAAMADLAKKWIDRFDNMAGKLGLHFAKSASDRTDAALRKILTDGGFALKKWTTTAAQRDAVGAIVHQSTQLIKSIPREYLADVEGDVMRSVAAGRDLSDLVRQLQDRYGSTRKRARLIAMHQNNYATAMLRRVRAMETGLDEWIWMHSSAKKHPRPTHVAAGKRAQRFKIAEGWYDPHEGRSIQPGELIHCGCTARPVIRGISPGRVTPGFGA